jgi:hypothetical protein
MLTMLDNKCKICEKEFGSLESVFRHIKAHEIKAKEYVLKWKHNGIVPLCSCGCGGETNWNIALKDFAKFIQGHHAHGRAKSDDEKRRIGEKNRANMKAWMARHPDIAKKKTEHMTSFKNPEVEERRINSTRKAYELMTVEDKQKFSDHAKRLWEDGTLAAAHVKAAETFSQRFANGEYDFAERNEKISAVITQRYLDSGFEWSDGRYVSVKTGKICNYRSSWELDLMKVLDFDDRVETWNYEPMSLPYVLEGKTRRYIPDFHIVSTNGKDYLVEVKPSNLSLTDMNTAKREAAQDFCEKIGWKYLEWNPDEVISLD